MILYEFNELLVYNFIEIESFEKINEILQPYILTDWLNKNKTPLSRLFKVKDVLNYKIELDLCYFYSDNKPYNYDTWHLPLITTNFKDSVKDLGCRIQDFKNILINKEAIQWYINDIIDKIKICYIRTFLINDSFGYKIRILYEID